MPKTTVLGGIQHLQQSSQGKQAWTAADREPRTLGRPDLGQEPAAQGRWCPVPSQLKGKRLPSSRHLQLSRSGLSLSLVFNGT